MSLTDGEQERASPVDLIRAQSVCDINGTNLHTHLLSSIENRVQERQ